MQKLLQALRQVVRTHWESYGTLNEPRPYLIGIAVAAGFLLFARLIFG
ncbi:hypothetical protein [Rhodobacter lacus]|uniref:Uncharacterized protein n=1 Tax=Rhodobacter lacus TaxID=1641972 RepID=A0ABW5AAP2_9RHOB